MKPTVSHDRDVNAAYIRFSSEKIFESSEISPSIVLDCDTEGRIVGMEVMDAAKHLAPDILNEAA